MLLNLTESPLSHLWNADGTSILPFLLPVRIYLGFGCSTLHYAALVTQGSGQDPRSQSGPWMVTVNNGHPDHLESKEFRKPGSHLSEVGVSRMLSVGCGRSLLSLPPEHAALEILESIIWLYRGSHAEDEAVTQKGGKRKGETWGVAPDHVICAHQTWASCMRI